MRRRAAWLGAFLGFWLSTATASAEPDPPPLPPLVLRFHESGADLPKDEIRAALERQLGRAVQTEVNPDLGELTVGRSIDGKVIVRYRPPRAELERTLPAPEAPEELAELVSLAAQNLILNQANEVMQEIEKAPPASTKPRVLSTPSPARKRVAPAAPPSPSPKPRAPRKRRGRTGLQLGVDYVYLPESDAVCSGEGRLNPGYYCYDGETPVNVEPVEAASVSPGVARGFGRFVLNQEIYRGPNLWVGFHWGVAFVSEPTRILPMRFATRFGYTFGDPDDTFQPKVFVGWSVGDFGAKVEARVRNEQAQRVDVWGRFSMSAIAGAGLTWLPRLAEIDGLGIELELPLMLSIYHPTVAATPTIGLVVAY